MILVKIYLFIILIVINHECEHMIIDYSNSIIQTKVIWYIVENDLTHVNELKELIQRSCRDLDKIQDVDTKLGNMVTIWLKYSCFYCKEWTVMHANIITTTEVFEQSVSPPILDGMDAIIFVPSGKQDIDVESLGRLRNFKKDVDKIPFVLCKSNILDEKHRSDLRIVYSCNDVDIDIITSIIKELKKVIFSI